MIIESVKNLDVQILGDGDSIEAGIDDASIPFILDMISTKMYSNPIGSIIREITSNCFDAHKEANVKDAVIVRKTYDIEEGYCIEFQDFGVGMSPDRIKNTYMKYWKSTKKASNDYIGAFGLGSKTPMSYTDYFYILTKYNGIEYSYIYHKGSKLPTIEPIYEQDTKERNGTIIKVPIKTADVSRFFGELGTQLSYFDNVYFDNWGIENKYKIYEGKYFKYRSNSAEKYIHVSMGKVRYDLDFTKVKVDLKHRTLPIAIKVEIGEIEVVPSREQISYTDKVVELLNERIGLAIDEILTMFEAQNPVIDDLKTYVEVTKSRPRITFSRADEHYLYLDAKLVSKNYRFKPIDHIPIKKIPSNFFFMWDMIGTINNGVYEDNRYGGSTLMNENIVNRQCVVIKKGERTSKYTDIYTRELSYFTDTVWVIRRKILSFDYISKELGLTGKGELGKARVIMQYFSAINNIITDKFRNYADLKPSDKWIADYKRKIYESSAEFIRKQAKKVFVRQFNKNGSMARDMLQYEFLDRTGIVVYGFREDKEILQQIYTTVAECKSYLYNKYENKYLDAKFLVVQISRSLENLIQSGNKVVYCKDFFKTKYFRKIYTAQIIANEMSYVDNMLLKSKLLKGFSEQYKIFTDYIAQHYLGKAYYVSSNILVKPIQEVIDLKDKFISEYGDIPLLGALNGKVNEKNKRDIIEFLKFKKIRLKNKYYLKTEDQLEKERQYRVGIEAWYYDTFIRNSNQLLIENNKNYGNTIKESNQD